jgi:hypothetical protein
MTHEHVERRKKSEQRVQYFLQTYHRHTTAPHVPRNTTDPVVTAEVEKYGLGRKRTLEAWYEFAGVDRISWNFTKNFCLKYASMRSPWPKEH